MIAACKLSVPTHYNHLVNIEGLCDYSMGYPATPGFRAGTAHPFYFYDLDNEVQTSVFVNPYCIHYTAIDKRMFYGQESLFSQLKKECERVNAPFVVMMENTQLNRSKRNHAFRILKMLFRK